MKILYPDKITSVIASDENASYPATNVSDNFRANFWRASEATTATLTIGVSANSNAVAISNTNCSSVTVEVKDVDSLTIYSPTAHSIDTDKPELWVDYATQSSTSTIILTFSNLATSPYCGVARASLAYEYENPQYGLDESLYDTSISRDFNNGANYYKKRNIARAFSGSLTVERATEFYTFMYDVIRQAGKTNMFWYLVDESVDMDWVVFGRINKMTTGAHSMYSHSEISFEFVEDVLGLTS